MELDKEYIDVESALKRVGGNKALLVKFLSKFVEDGYIETLEKSLAAKDLETAARDAHSIKGVGANLSLPKITAAALELEQKIKNGEDYAESLESLKEIYAVTAQQIEIVTQQA